MQLRQLDSNQAVELVEEKLQFWQLFLVQMAHIENVSNAHQSLKTQLLISENQEKEAGYEIHTLAVFNFGVEKGISFEYIIQNFWFNNMPEIMKGALNVHGNEFRNWIFECSGLVYFSVIFESPVLLTFAVYFVSECVIVFWIRIYT